MINLRLPICPECNDTKNVHEHSQHTLVIRTLDYQAWTCYDCGRYWESTGLSIEENEREGA